VRDLGDSATGQQGEGARTDVRGRFEEGGEQRAGPAGLVLVAVALALVPPPVAAQADLREQEALCGPQCLAFAAAWLGTEAEVTELARLAGTDPQTGTSLAGLGRAAAHVGLEARPYRLRLKDLRHLTSRTPAIARVDAAHFYVVWAEPDGRLRVVEPPEGSWRSSLHAFGRRFDGAALIVSLPGQQPSFGSILPAAGATLLLIALAVALMFGRRPNARTTG
jgi:hypothetical protein